METAPFTKQQHLRNLVYDRNKWDEPLSDADKANGFLGWHERGYLPHYDKPGLVQLVTLRLADSLPRSRIREWEHLLKIENVRERRKKLESYLDRGIGECWLKDPHIAELCEDALLHFHKERYELLAWCVMPNHVHVLVHVWDWPLWKMVQHWKIRVAMESRRRLRKERRAPARQEPRHDDSEPSGGSALQAFWQREYWDTFMRSEAQEKKAIHYIEANPVKAHLCQETADWPHSSARFRDEYLRLVLTAKP